MKVRGKAVFGMFFPMMNGERPCAAAAVKPAHDAMGAACAG
jgi:hypothetical protein